MPQIDVAKKQLGLEPGAGAPGQTPTLSPDELSAQGYPSANSDPGFANTINTSSDTPKVLASVPHPDGSSTHVLHVPALISKAIKTSSTAMKVAPEAQGQSAQSGAAADGTGNGESNQTTIGGRAARPTSEAQSSTPADNNVSSFSDASQANGPDEQALKTAASPNTVLPSLAPQGGKNAFTRWLSRFVGTAGPTPEAGEKYTGPTNATELAKSEANSPLSKVLSIAGRVGGALEAAKGTPEQQQLAEQRAEFIPKTQLELQALKNEQAYRTGMLGINEQKAQTLEEKAQEIKRKDDGVMRAKGYVPDPSGGYRAMNEDEILADPQLSQNTQLRQAAIMSKQAQQELNKAHADAIMNPNNPTFQQKEREIQSRLAMAQAHLQVARGNLELNAQRIAAEGQRDQWQFGRNSMTGADLTPQNAPPGMLADASGNPVPTRMQTMFGPTGQQKSSAGRAKQMIDAVPNVISQINALKDELGPIMGRWNEFRQGKIGADDPSFAALNMNLELVASGVTLAHSLGRMPTVLFDTFNQQINAPQQTPENLISTLQAVIPYLKAIQDIGTPKRVGGGTAAPTTPIHAAATASSIPSVADWQAKRSASVGGR